MGKRLILSMIIVMSIFFFTACPKHIDLSSEDRSFIKKVSISKKIALPEDMYYFGPGDFGYTGGVLDYLLAQAIYSAVVDVPEDLKGKPKEVFKLIMSNHNINVDEIIFEAFSKNLAKSKIFTLEEQQPTNFNFKLSVVIYGFANPHGLSSQLKPMLGVTGKLINANDKIIWEKYEYVTNLSNATPINTAENFLKNPELIREAFTSAAEIVSEGLIDDLKN